MANNLHKGEPGLDRSQSKYFNTAQRMNNALIELLVEKDFEFITIMEICKRAGVSRSTFYLHYRTIGDLLDECTENVIKRFFSYYEEENHNFAEQIATHPPATLVTVTPEFLVPYLIFIKENILVFQAHLVCPQAMNTNLLFQHLFDDVLNPIFGRFEVPENERRYRAVFYLTGINAIIQEWIKHDCSDSVEYIAELITKCVLPNVSESEIGRQ